MRALAVFFTGRSLFAAATVVAAVCSVSSAEPPELEAEPRRSGAPEAEARSATAAASFREAVAAAEPAADPPLPVAQPSAAVAGRPDPDRRPGGLLQLPSEIDAALVVDLEGNRLHIFRNHADPPVHAESLYVAIGKNGGDKLLEGDEKTPVGIYYVKSYRSPRELPAIYGAGALPINYPNTWDRRLGRSGSGIWIHGSDKDAATLPPQSSRGCLTLADPDFLSVAKSVELARTPVIISNRLTWSSPEEIQARRRSVAAALEAWRRDWESLDTDAYLGHYSASFRTETMSLRAWTAHKRRVNAHKRFIRVALSEIGIYGYPGERDLVLVTFHQDYRSSNFNQRKWKQQFWRLEEGGWHIVHEGGGI